MGALGELSHYTVTCISERVGAGWVWAPAEKGAPLVCRCVVSLGKVDQDRSSQNIAHWHAGGRKVYRSCQAIITTGLCKNHEWGQAEQG